MATNVTSKRHDHTYSPPSNQMSVLQSISIPSLTMHLSACLLPDHAERKDELFPKGDEIQGRGQLLAKDSFQ